MDTKILYNENDYEAIKILDGFLPDKIFDTHMHLLDSDFAPGAVTDGKRVVCEIEDYKREMGPVLCNPKVLRTNIITHPDASMADLSTGNYKKADDFLIRQLNKEPQCVGEIIVFPSQTPEDIEKRLVHPGIRGFKCYFSLGSGDRTYESSIGEYLPEDVWEVANKNKMCITLHMVKEKALADKDNLEYIKRMAKKYPDAVLIFLTAPSAQELKNRLVGRGTEDVAVIEKRMKRAVEESEDMHHYEFIVVNDDLDQCVKDVNSVIVANCCKLEENIEFMNKMKAELKAL